MSNVVDWKDIREVKKWAMQQKKQGAVEELERLKEYWISLGTWEVSELYNIECKLKEYIENSLKELKEGEVSG